MAGDAALYDVNVFWDFPFLTDIDFTSDQFCFAVLGSDGYLDICGAGALALGVIQDAPGLPVRASRRSHSLSLPSLKVWAPSPIESKPLSA